METEAFYGPSGLFLEQARPPSSRRWPFDGDALAIGRDPSSAICVNDATISEHHADLIRRGLTWFVVDARSTNGTFVNDRQVNESVVQAYDRIRVGRVEFIVREADLGRRGGQTQTMRDEWPWHQSGGASSGGSLPARPAGPAPARFQVDRQSGGVIINAETINQIERRENLLRDVAATKTKARWLAWTGFVTFLAGFGLFAYADLSFIKQISNSFQTGQEPSTISPFGRNIAGVPIGLIGWAIGVIGMVLLIVGIVLHIVATSRRKRADREFPMPGYGRMPGHKEGEMIINNQTAGVANNVEGSMTIYGGQQGTVVTDQVARRAVRDLQSALPSAVIDRATKEETLAQAAEIDAAMRAPRPDKSRIAEVLKRLTRLLAAAGSLTTAGSALIGPLQALASWLGALGDPIMHLLFA